MEKRWNKSLNETLPLLAFGAMRLPKTTEGEIDYPASTALIERAIDSGLNYFDTAMPYHSGESELFLGEILPRFKRDSYFLADKLPIYSIKKEGDMEYYFQHQLERCKTDYFDFYMVHNLSGDMHLKPFEQFKLYDFMVQAKKEAKIRHIGFSFHGNPELLRYLVDTYQWEFVQLQINYYDWSEINAKELYDILEERGIPCFIMEPVRGGFLSSFHPDTEKIMQLENPNHSLSSWALRWAASLPNVAVVLSGMSNSEQLEDNINTFTQFEPISAKEQLIIDDVVAQLQSIKPVPCTRCNYCLPCPSNVKIPAIFQVYNNFKKTGNHDFLKMQYNNNFVVSANERAHLCTQCGACISKCPQQIQIPDELHKIHSILEEMGDIL